jgi:hypothetical protein
VRNEPNLGRPGQGQVPEMRKMRNEPNSSIADWRQACGGTPAPRPAAFGLRRARRAKQTQFLAAEIPHYSTVLSFHHSNSPGAGWVEAARTWDGWQTCKTNPISEGLSSLKRQAECEGQVRKTKPIRRKSGEDAQPTKRQSCETKPNLGGLGHLADGTCRELIVRNEANFGYAAWHGHPARGPESWAGCPCHLRPIMQNEPNSRRCRVGRGLGDEGQMRKTNPICPPPDGQAGPWLEPVVRNPNFGHRGCREPPLFRSSGVCQSCETNPIAGRAGWAGAWRTRAGGCCTNKPNFRRGRAVVRNKANWRWSRQRSKSL